MTHNANLTDKLILVIPQLPVGFFGISHGVKENLDYYWNQNGLAIDRAKADDKKHPLYEYRQIIPYVTVLAEGGDGLSVLGYQRLEGGNESNLHHKISLGFGGHVKWDDNLLPSEMLEQTVYKELAEELDIYPKEEQLELQGELIGDLEKVDMLHQGVWYKCNLGEWRSDFMMLTTPEKEKIRLLWIPVAELPLLFDRLETWAKLVARRLLLE